MREVLFFLVVVAVRTSALISPIPTSPPSTIQRRSLVVVEAAGGSAKKKKKKERRQVFNLKGPNQYSATSVASLYKPRAKATYDTVTVRERNGRILPIPQQKRYRSREWVRNLIEIPTSKTLHRIRSPVAILGVWGLVVALLEVKFSFGVTFTFLHGLLGSTLGLLLTFRTNAAYTRYWEGRTVWQGVVDRCRDLTRLSAVYANCLGSARYARVCALICRFPLVLEYHLEGRKSTREAMAGAFIDEVVSERDDVTVKTVKIEDLPKNERRLARHYATKSRFAATPNQPVLFEPERSDHSDEFLLSFTQEKDEYKEDEDEDLPETKRIKEKEPSLKELDRGMRNCANRPLFVANALVSEFREVPDSPCGFFTNRERAQLIDRVNKLATSIGACERLIMTPVPLSYARHTSRFLSLWCLSLPFVIAPTLGPPLTAFTMALVSWGLFGIQEIGLIIEDPFRGALKLGVLSDMIICDVRETSTYFTKKEGATETNHAAAHGASASGSQHRHNGERANAPADSGQSSSSGSTVVEDYLTKPGFGSDVTPLSAYWARDLTNSTLDSSSINILYR